MASRASEPMLPSQTVPTGEFDGTAGTVDERTLKRDMAEALLQIPDVETPVDALLDDAGDDDGNDDDGDDYGDVRDDDDADSAGGGGDDRRGVSHSDSDPHVEPQRGAGGLGASLRPPSIDMPTIGAAMRGDAPIDAQTEKFERGDPTQSSTVDATEIQAPRGKHPTGGTLRRSAALRRKRGLRGDVRYVFTALFGVRRSRRELAALEHRQGLRQTSRRRHLVLLGRSAAVMEGFDHPALGKARDHLGMIEDERSKHAGAVAASDAELERVRRDRDAKAQQVAIDVAATDAEVAEVAKKLEPLEKAAAVAKKRAADLRDELHRIDKQIADKEALLGSTKGEKLDKAAIHADVATFKANRQAVLRDEPVLAAELDALDPRIAALESTRSELHKQKAELGRAEQEDQRRTLELLDAIGAKRKVVERAAADSEAARDVALFELGERLYVDRPSQLTPQLSPIDQIDLELGEGDRRAMELKEILSNIDKAKFARGLAMIILVLGVAGSVIGGVLYALL